MRTGGDCAQIYCDGPLPASITPAAASFTNERRVVRPGLILDWSGTMNILIVAPQAALNKPDAPRTRPPPAVDPG